ncbi:MgtC/SapB family protein [Chitinimonas sp.]|uniref:MgtC/SapB family protein n=1 Tax=Chitinimonas sp. TaxID=1934313 RepID=UPI002F91D7BA
MSGPDNLLPLPALALLPAFATSLALGLLMGLERERKPSARAGLRTFALTALLGTVCGLLAARLGANWLIAVGLACVALAIVGAYLAHPLQDDDPGTTTEIALLLCYLLGVLCWFEERSLAIGLGVAATVLLQFKTELAGLVRRLSPDDVRSILQFAVLSLVILPVLPDRDFGPYQAFNPYQTWLMVVLISGVGLAGYLALRVFGQRAGVLIAGLLGGLVSSTATMLVHARQAQQSTEPIQAGSTIVVVSNLTVLVRLMMIGAIADPAIAGRLSLVLGSGLLGGLLAALPARRVEQADSLMAATSNPTELKTALGFAAMYSLVLLAAAWLNNELGHVGLYAVALLSGATDVDAITLSSLHMHTQGRLQAMPTMFAIVLAVAANTIFKLILAFSIGGRRFGLRVVWPMLAAVVSSILALWALPA